MWAHSGWHALSHLHHCDICESVNLSGHTALHLYVHITTVSLQFHTFFSKWVSSAPKVSHCLHQNNFTFCFSCLFSKNSTFWLVKNKKLLVLTLFSFSFLFWLEVLSLWVHNFFSQPCVSWTCHRSQQVSDPLTGWWARHTRWSSNQTGVQPFVLWHFSSCETVGGLSSVNPPAAWLELLGWN